MKLDESTVRGLAALPVTKERVEMDLVHLLAPVFEGERPFFPLAVVALDEKELAATSNIITPPQSIYERAAHEAVTLFEKAGGKPKTVVLRDNSFADTIAPVLTEAGIVCTYQEELPGLTELVEFLDEQFQSVGSEE